MSLRPLASLTVKMLGLYTALNAVPAVFSAFSPLLAGRALQVGTLSPLRLALFYASDGGLRILLGVVLWWFSDVIALRAVREEGDVSLRVDESLTSVGFLVVGVYLLGEFAVELSRYATSVYMVNQDPSLFRPETMHMGANDVIPMLVRGAIAIYLLIGARGVAGALARFRDVGRDLDTQS